MIRQTHRHVKLVNVFERDDFAPPPPPPRSRLRDSILRAVAQYDTGEIALMRYVIQYVSRKGLPEPTRIKDGYLMWEPDGKTIIGLFQDGDWYVMNGEQRLSRWMVGFPWRRMADELAQLLILEAIRRREE